MYIFYDTNVHIICFVHRETDKPIFSPTFAELYVHNEEDTYVTLEVLAAILEKLSEGSGKIWLN